MPSNALDTHLAQLLKDADELKDMHANLSTIVPIPQDGLDAMNRALVVMAVSAWESFIEELVVEAVSAMRPVQSPLGSWSVHFAATVGQTKRFHTPNPENVKDLISDAIGLADIRLAWRFQNQSSSQNVEKLRRALHLRHQISHGINPRPRVAHAYANRLPEFFRRLSQSTDAAVRNHLVANLGIANPWPP